MVIQMHVIEVRKGLILNIVEHLHCYYSCSDNDIEGEKGREMTCKIRYPK